MKTPVRTVAIIGGGPSGLALASLLAMRGVEVTVFEDGKRPDLIVGESLVPAVVPVLRRLGIEERVAAIGLHKPGTCPATRTTSPAPRSMTFSTHGRPNSARGG